MNNEVTKERRGVALKNRQIRQIREREADAEAERLALRANGRVELAAEWSHCHVRGARGGRTPATEANAPYLLA